MTWPAATRCWPSSRSPRSRACRLPARSCAAGHPCGSLGPTARAPPRWARWSCRSSVSTYTPPASAGAEDQTVRQRLVRYVLRPPLAKERLTLLPDNRVRLDLKRPFSDGTYALEMDVLSLLARLAASVPPPRTHLVRYSGVLAPASPWRPLVIPPVEPAPAATPETPAPPSAHSEPPPKPPRTGPRCHYWPWAELMRLTLGLPVDTCPHCGGRMKLRALVRDPESIERFLRHQNLWTLPLGLAEARPPPYYRSVTRLRPSPQVELFE